MTKFINKTKLMVLLLNVFTLIITDAEVGFFNFLIIIFNDNEYAKEISKIGNERVYNLVVNNLDAINQMIRYGYKPIKYDTFISKFLKMNLLCWYYPEIKKVKKN